MVVATSSARAQELTEQRRIEVARQLAESTVSVISGPSTGSGFVVGEERWIVTNSHVIRPAARYGVEVHFASGERVPARVVADVPSRDLAVLEPRGQVRARPLALGDSDRAAVGQNVLAFGSPFGLEGTLTQGIVSAIRDVPAGSGLAGGGIQRVIQTDAPINPGNSGGPLVSARGEVIGVNTAILSRTGGSHGIGFAIPSNVVRSLLDEVRQSGRVAERDTQEAPRVRAAEAGEPFLGIYGATYRTRGFAGVQIQGVVPGSPAQVAGLVGVQEPPPAAIAQMGVPWTGHIIVAVDDRRVRSMEELDAALQTRRPGERAVLTVTVGPGALTGRTVVTLAPRPAEQP